MNDEERRVLAMCIRSAVGIQCVIFCSLLKNCATLHSFRGNPSLPFFSVIQSLKKEKANKRKESIKNTTLKVSLLSLSAFLYWMWKGRGRTKLTRSVYYDDFLSRRDVTAHSRGIFIAGEKWISGPNKIKTRTNAHEHARRIAEREQTSNFNYVWK